MSEENKDNKEFEFIKEQVIQKKRKKLKKWLIPFFMTISMAILFGLVAAVTFCIAEPRLYPFLHGEKEDQKPVVIPTPIPSDPEDGDEIDESVYDPDEEEEHIGGNDSKEQDPGESKAGGQAGEEQSANQPGQTVVESIDADINDYIKIFDEIKELAYQSNNSILTVSSIIDGKDWFGNPVEKRIYTSGIVIDNSGTNLLLLVSLDRVKDASSIQVELNETTVVDAVLKDFESEINLAVISASLVDIHENVIKNIKKATIGESYTITAGTPVIALGSPNGYPDSLDVGIITSKGSYISITDFKLDLFNTDMTFHSESDGVIINLKGEVIGIITRTLKEDLNENLGTVIGISKVKSIIERMSNKTPRIYCGIIAEDMTEAARTEHGVARGIYIYEVKADSPAFEAGLKGGDIILNVNDRIISNMNSFYNTISEYEPGTEVTMKIKRTSGSTDKEMDLKIVLDEKKQ